jgi:hypothetical protein
MVTIHNTPQNSEEWLQARIGKFTGSNAIKLLKHGRTDRARVQETEFKGNKWTQRGHDLEPYAIAAYEQVKDVKVNRPGFITNDKYPECLFSPDGLLEDSVIEVKCFGEKRHNDIHIRNIPDEILAQVHFGMIMCEKKNATLVLFNPDLEPKKALKIIKIKRDPRLTKRLVTLMQGGKNDN